MSERQGRVTSELAAYWLRSTYRVKISAGAVRQWAHRGHLRERYDLWEVEDEARRRGLI